MRFWRPVGRLGARSLLVLAVVAADAAAQDAFPLRAMEFEGSEHFSDEALASVADLALGQSVRKRDFDAALRRLNETGLFESLRYRFEPQGDGYRLTILVTEAPELFPVRFEGFDAPAEELRALLEVRLPLYVDLAPADGPMVRLVENSLRAWWNGQGHEEDVAGALAPAADAGYEMVFGPVRETNNIAFVRFRNTGDVDPRELQRTFNQVAVGEPYTEARLRELLRYNAQPLYTELGYMNVAFCPCEASPDPDSEGLLVDVEVRQGEVYLFGAVTWPDPLPLDPDSLRKVNRIASGQVANMKAAYATMAAISEGMKRAGYMKAHAAFEEQVDHDARTVSLAIAIAPGQQYAFSRLIVKGLDILSEPAVRKRWGLRPGDPFDVRYPAYFLDRIKADAMFENLKRTSWNVEIDEANGRIDVILVFSGALPAQP